MHDIVQYGLYAELRSISDHSNALRIASHMHNHHKHQKPDTDRGYQKPLSDSMFEFHILGFGLALAFGVFIGEHIVNCILNRRKKQIIKEKIVIRMNNRIKKSNRTVIGKNIWNNNNIKSQHII